MEFRDPICATSHLMTAIWAVFAALILYRLAPPLPGRRLAVAGYGMSMVILYTFSTLFHAVPFTHDQNPIAFRFFQRLDQSAVFIFIAGTNTPIMAILLRGWWQAGCLRGMWGLALSGVACLWIVDDPPYLVIVGICVAIGLLGLLPIRHYLKVIPWGNSLWAWLGVGLYTAAALCELLNWPRVADYPYRIGSHEVFHILVSFASVAFFVFITRHVIGHRTRRANRPLGVTDSRLMPVHRLLVSRPTTPRPQPVQERELATAGR